MKGESSELKARSKDSPPVRGPAHGAPDPVEPSAEHLHADDQRHRQGDTDGYLAWRGHYQPEAGGRLAQVAAQAVTDETKATGRIQTSPYTVVRNIEAESSGRPSPRSARGLAEAISAAGPPPPAAAG